MLTIFITRVLRLRNKSCVLHNYFNTQERTCCGKVRFFSSSNEGSKSLNYKIVFLGSDHFSLPSLIALTQLLPSGHVSVVVSHENNVIGKYAKHNSLELLHWNQFKTVEYDEEVRRRNDQGNGFDFGVVASFGYLIPARVIQRFPLGILNVHASLLPRWRGASPIAHSIIYGDTKTGISIMKIAPHKFDIGPILLTSEIPLHPHIRSPELNKILSQVGANALSSVISDLDRYNSNPVPQDDTQASLSPKLTPEMGEIDWPSVSSKSVYDLFRGLCGFTKLRTSFLNRRVDLDEIGLIDLVQEVSSAQICGNDNSSKSVIDSSTDFEKFYPYPVRVLIKKLPESGSPGQIIYKKDINILCVKCGGESKSELSPWIFVRKVKLGNKWMDAKDFQNGFLSKCKPDQRCFVYKPENNDESVVNKITKINS